MALNSFMNHLFEIMSCPPPYHFYSINQDKFFHLPCMCSSLPGHHEDKRAAVQQQQQQQQQHQQQYRNDYN